MKLRHKKSIKSIQPLVPFTARFPSHDDLLIPLSLAVFCFGLLFKAGLHASALSYPVVRRHFGVVD
jgi:hypothetical protein